MVCCVNTVHVWRGRNSRCLPSSAPFQAHGLHGPSFAEEAADTAVHLREAQSGCGDAGHGAGDS